MNSIVDLGAAYDVVSELLRAERHLERLLEKVLEKTRGVPVAVSILKHDGIEDLGELASDTIVILEMHSGISFGPYDQIDNEGDRVGSLCPTRGREWLREFVSRIAEKYKGVVLDLCNFFLYTHKGLSSCLCNNCLVELRNKIEKEIPEFLKGADISLTADEVIEEIKTGPALRVGILGEDPDGWEPLSIPSGRFIDVLKSKHVARSRESFYEHVSNNEVAFKRALASLVLFVRGRSKIALDFVREVFHGLDCYKAVALEGSDRAGFLSVSPEIIGYLIEDGIDVWVDREIPGARYYNLRRTRYILGHLNESMLNAIVSIESGYRGNELIKLISEIGTRWFRLAKLVKTSWILDPKSLGNAGVKIAEFGWPKEIMTFLSSVVDLITRDYDYLLELREARNSFHRYDISSP